MLSFAEKWKRIGAFKEQERIKWMRTTSLRDKLRLLATLLSDPWPVPPASEPVGPYSYEKRMEVARRARERRARRGGPRRRR